MQTLTWFCERNWLWMVQEWAKSHLKGKKSPFGKFWKQMVIFRSCCFITTCNVS